MDNPFDLVLLLGAGQGILLALVLMSIKRRNRKANTALASIIAIFSLSIGIHTLFHFQETDVLHHSDLILIFFFLIGPLLLLYVRLLTLKNYELKEKDLIHLIPFVLGMLIYLPYLIMILLEVLPVQNWFAILNRIISWTLIAHILAYFVITLRALAQYSIDIKESYSSLEKINLNWLKILISVFGLTWLITFYFEMFGDKSDSMNFAWLFVSLFIYLIGYMGLRQPEIFTGQELADVSESPQKKYEKSTLTPEAAEEYLGKVNSFMNQEKPFLQGDLTLHALAKMVAISPHHLSQVINEKIGMNFFEFINKHRVEEVKYLLSRPDNANLNIASLGLDAGFNSISAFNAAFKKHAGQTPSQYKDSLS